jgi:ankyrin repeat protein
MSARDSVSQLRIASPCSVAWNSMTGNDRVRFCEHCQLSVHNIDFASRKQIRRLIARSGARICVSYRQPDVAKPSVAPILYKIGRRTSVIAASAFSATLSISSAVAAGTNLKSTSLHNHTTVAGYVQDPVSTAGNGKLYGYVFDPNGAALPGASVLLRNSATSEPLYTMTSGSGEYRFEGLKPGSYHLTINSRGFDSQNVPNILVRADDNNRIDQTLSIAPIEAEVTIESSANIVAGGAMISLPTDPLVKAAYDDDLAALQTALLNRPDVNLRDKLTQSSALEYAVRNGNREIVQALLWAKVDVNARDNEGQTVLMLLSDETTDEIVWDLINAGAKVNLRDKDGDTALISVAEVNNVEALKVLLDAGAKVNGTNNDGETALMLAASNGLVHNVRALIFAGADVNARDKEGKSALMYAIEDDHKSVIRLLKAHGAIEFEAPEKQ